MACRFTVWPIFAVALSAKTMPLEAPIINIEKSASSISNVIITGAAGILNLLSLISSPFAFNEPDFI